MDTPYISIPTSDISQFSESTQAELIKYLGFHTRPLEGKASIVAQNDEEIFTTTNDGPVELTPLLIRKLTKKLSKNTLLALRAIAQSPTEEFHMKDIIGAIDGVEDYMGLRGVWSGLTRRTRNILQDSNADIIWWGEEEIYDENENYVDHLGKVSKLTWKSLKAHFS